MQLFALTKCFVFRTTIAVCCWMIAIDRSAAVLAVPVQTDATTLDGTSGFIKKRISYTYLIYYLPEPKTEPFAEVDNKLKDLKVTFKRVEPGSRSSYPVSQLPNAN